jgi:hypothetical protein
MQMVLQGGCHYNLRLPTGPRIINMRIFGVMHRFGFRLLLALSAFTCAWPVLAQQVTIERDTPLHAEARTDAKVVARLKQGSSGEVVGKSGAWLNLKTPEASGWLFSFNVRFASAQSGAQSSSGGGDAVVGRLFGPRQQINVTSTMGVRGLEEEDLKQARLNPEQLKLLDQYAASKQDAEGNAQATGLSAVRVDYLDGR